MSKADKGTTVGATGGAVAGAVVGGPVGAVAGAGIGAYAGNYAGAKSDPAHPGEGTMSRTAEARDASAPQRTAQADTPSSRSAMGSNTTPTPASNTNLTSGNTSVGNRDTLTSQPVTAPGNLASGAASQGMPGSHTSMHGEATVRQVQEALLKAGYDPGPIDGVMGPRTEQALSRFQQAKGLSSSANLDASTLSALGVSQ